MNDQIKTQAEELEAAVQYHDDKAKKADAELLKLTDMWNQGHATGDSIHHELAKVKQHERHAAAIRALSSRISPAPDDEALVEQCEYNKDVLDHDLLRRDIRAVIAALREAGALR